MGFNSKAALTVHHLAATGTHAKILASNNVQLIDKNINLYPQITVHNSLTTESVNGLIIVSPPLKVNGDPTFTYHRGTNIFNSTTQDLNNFIYNLYQYMGENYSDSSQTEYTNKQFSKERYVFLFKPGTYYNINMLLNYYISYIGGGNNKNDVIFLQSTLIAPPSINYPKLGGLDNFWRSAENFTIDSNGSSYPSSWVKYNDYFPDSVLLSVSQASPIRNIQINNSNLYTFQISEKINYASVYCSGGFMSDIYFNNDSTKKLNFGGQQQFYCRNVKNIEASNISGGAWNIVMNDDITSNDDSMSGKRVTNMGVVNIPLKPYYSLEENSIVNNSTSITDFSIFNPTSTINEINTALSSGKSIILTPGYYNIDAPIVITNHNTVLLSLGMVTVENQNSGECLIINDDLNNVKVAGIVIQASESSVGITNTLIKVGNTVKNNSSNIFLHDIFVRVGGPSLKPTNNNRVDKMMVINSNNVILDNCWLWRADHTNSISGGLGPTNAVCNHALEVNGNNVKAYGLSCEHTLQDIVTWNGDNGEVNFYQCELPYDVENHWDYSGFVINGSNFKGYGMGVYCFFAKKWEGSQETFTNHAIKITNSDYTLKNIFTVFLDSQNGQGSIKTVIFDSVKNKYFGPLCNNSVTAEPMWSNLPIGTQLGEAVIEYDLGSIPLP